jgi:hypothetical protein
MADEFKGEGTPLCDADFAEAAERLGCAIAALRAVAQVESAGAGFLPDCRPKLLFERHVFHARTGGKYSAVHAAVSSPQRGGYLGGTREYDRLHAAIELDRKAALESASWGKFQIMGFNYSLAGHTNVECFVEAMVSGEPAQLAAFVAFIRACKLDGALIRGDWASFARGYNGSAYAENAYDRKMAQAYAAFAGEGECTAKALPLLKRGDSGCEVLRLQRLLGRVQHGKFDLETEAAVVAFQTSRGLGADGRVGAKTWKALLGR